MKSATNGRGGSGRGQGGTPANLHIGIEYGRRLRTLLKAQLGRPNRVGHDEMATWVQAQIDAAYAEFEAETERAAEKTWDGEVL